MSNKRKLYDIQDDVCSQLLEKGEEALNNCYPKAGEGYAVAVLTSKGNIYTGHNDGHPAVSRFPQFMEEILFSFDRPRYSLLSLSPLQRKEGGRSSKLRQGQHLHR